MQEAHDMQPEDVWLNNYEPPYSPTSIEAIGPSTSGSTDSNQLLEESRALRIAQDEAYEESLRIDRDKVLL